MSDMTDIPSQAERDQWRQAITDDVFSRGRVDRADLLRLLDALDTYEERASVAASAHRMSSYTFVALIDMIVEKIADGGTLRDVLEIIGDIALHVTAAVMALLDGNTE